MKRLYSSLFALSLACGFASAEYVVVARETRVFDGPAAKDATAAMSGADVVAKPGMVFVKESAQGGWNKVEYLTGMRAYINADMIASGSAVTLPSAGEYGITNGSSKVTITADGGKYSLRDAKATYSGKAENNAVIFRDVCGNMTYSAVILNGRTYIYNYTSLGW